MVRTLDTDSSAVTEKRSRASAGRGRSARDRKRKAGSTGGVRTAKAVRNSAGPRAEGGRTAAKRTSAVRADKTENSAGSSANSRQTTAMSLQTVAFMLALIAVMTVMLIYYIKLQADVTSTSQQIANLEKQLTEIKAENDAAYNEINDSISLEEVRRRAIQELGMKYADRDQVVIYSGTEKDTVNQVSSLNE